MYGQLFEDAKLIEVLIALAKKQDFTFPTSSNTTHQGYLGFVIKIANQLVKLSEMDEELNTRLEGKFYSFIIFNN